jgi:hypothetical protein
MMIFNPAISGGIFFLSYIINAVINKVPVPLFPKNIIDKKDVKFIFPIYKRPPPLLKIYGACRPIKKGPTFLFYTNYKNIDFL